MTEGKRNLIQGLLQEYDIQSADDIQEALKDLLSGTIQDMGRYIYCKEAINMRRKIMIEIINKYGIYGKYIFLICTIICVIFFLKKKIIMPINKFKPLSIIIILGILLFVGVGIAVITIVTSNNASNWYLKK